MSDTSFDPNSEDSSHSSSAQDPRYLHSKIQRLEKNLTETKNELQSTLNHLKRISEELKDTRDELKQSKKKEQELEAMMFEREKQLNLTIDFLQSQLHPPSPQPSETLSFRQIKDKRKTLELVNVDLELPRTSIKIEDEIARGTFGIVYSGKIGNVSVAVKELNSGKLTNTSVEELHKEARIMSKARSAKIVQLFGICSKKSPYWLVMEKMKCSLFDRIHDTSDPFLMSHRVQIGLDIISGLDWLHSQEIIHRDLKSKNVLLDEKGTAKLTDFGLSTIQSEILRSTRSSIIEISSEVGTLAWMAPELLDSLKKTKHSYASDIYAYGVVLWELLTLKIPFHDVLTHNLRNHLLSGKKLEIPKETLPQLAQLIQKCFEFKPENRPAASTIFQKLAEILPSDSYDIRQVQDYKVDVTSSMKDKIQDLLDSTVYTDPETKARDPSQFGRGRDVKKLDPERLPYNQLKVVQVYQINNPDLLEDYQLQRERFSKIFSKAAINAPRNFNNHFEKKNKILTNKKWMEVNSKVNEVYLLSGTKARYVNNIIQEGLSEKVSSLRGTFGAGIYFAENSDKADQYSVSDKDGLCCMFVCRVLIGRPYLTKKALITSQEDLDKAIRTMKKLDQGSDCHSIVALRGTPEECAVHRHREFVVFDSRQVYPEYLVMYQRKIDLSLPICLPTNTQANAFLTHSWDAFEACKNGEYQQLLLALVKHKISPNLKGKRDRTLLSLAVRKNHKKIAQLLHPNQPDCNHRIPLHEASFRGYKEIVEILISSGSNPNLEDINKRIPLHEASLRGHKEIIEILIKEGSNLFHEDKDKKLPIDLAVDQSDFLQLHRLIQNNMLLSPELLRPYLYLINSPDENRQTPLHIASIKGQAENVGLLVANGAKINVQESIFGMTPLMFSCLAKNFKIAQTLLQSGADVNAETKTTFVEHTERPPRSFPPKSTAKDIALSLNLKDFLELFSNPK